MPSKKQNKVWEAKPHTIAKINILEEYLFRWFQIMGSSKSGQNIVYVDGFAGPGEYTNYSNGSPLAALIVAMKSLASTAITWRAGDLHCIFVEADTERYSHLHERLEPFRNITPFKNSDKLKIQTLNLPFAEALASLKHQMPYAFSGSHPLLVFIDPFGAKGVPFSSVSDVLNSPCSEVLINLDADGIARIFHDQQSVKHEQLMNEIFGSDSWKGVLSRDTSFPVLCRQVLDLYKDGLRKLKGVKYVFPFEMRSSGEALNYYLVFASQHPLGLEKMKEAMLKMDQTGDYRFSDASIGQTPMFRFDDPLDYANRLFNKFLGEEVTYSELNDYALNETPFRNPKSMLKLLEEQNMISVNSVANKRRKGTFNAEYIKSIRFKPGGQNGS